MKHVRRKNAIEAGTCGGESRDVEDRDDDPRSIAAHFVVVAVVDVVRFVARAPHA